MREYLNIAISFKERIFTFFGDVLFPTLGFRRKINNCIATLFVGPNADEQNLSKKATVICQDENPSSSEKRLHKGTVES